ncbi:MAG: hypothetical protein AAGA31_14625, partial [Bacteroidota bacterium]
MKTIFFSCSVLALLVLGLMGTTPSGYGNEANYHRFYLPFYAESIQVVYDPAMTIAEPRSIDNYSIRSAYRSLQRKPTRVLLNSLLEAKEKYQLNDYLFYKLARHSMQVVYDGRSRNALELSLYKLLIEAGFDVRLTYRGNQVFVNVYTNEDLFEVPIIDTGGRPYANLSCLAGECNGRQRLYIYQDRPNPNGRSFGFQLRSWPALSSQPKVKNMRFTYHGITKNMEVTFDQTMVDIMSDYPFIHEYCYLETPLSPTLQKSLLPQLRRYLKPLDQQQRLELLASFTRSAFNYKEDNEYFGRSKPMVPEELFGYSYSDCEDRSALFFALVRDLLNLPMAVVAYDDHLTIAVGSASIPGDSFTYNNQRYVFCDPTGPKNSSRIGQIPPGYENKNFHIFGT